MAAENMMEELKAMVWGCYRDDEIKLYYWEMMASCSPKEMQEAFHLIMRHRQSLGDEIFREMIDRLLEGQSKTVVYPEPMSKWYTRSLR